MFSDPRNGRHLSHTTENSKEEVLESGYKPYKKLTDEQLVYLMSHNSLVNIFTIAYMLVGYVMSLYCLVYSGSLLVSFIGTVLLTHTMIVALTITHECIHSSVAPSLWLNRVVGELSLIVSGALYVPFIELQQQHNAHHATHVGIDSFLVSHILSTWPHWMRLVVLPLEACYIPVLSLVAWWRTVLVPLWKPKYRRLRMRIVVVLLLRHTFFYGMWYIRPTSLAFYLVGQILFINIMRVYDAYHHTYVIMPRGTIVHTYNATYEQKMTYSTIFGWHTPLRCLLDMLFLNYGYHNAHHLHPKAPWYRLQELDAIMYPESNVHVVRLPDALKEFHKKRIDRITLRKDDSWGAPKRDTVKNADGVILSEFIGVVMNISSLVLDIDD